MNFSSKLIQDAVEQFSKLPGIGRKSAMRLALHLLKMDKDEVRAFGEAFIDLREKINYCQNAIIFRILIFANCVLILIESLLPFVWLRILGM